MTEYKIEVNGTCMGCGTCVAVCPEFKLGSDRKAYPTDETVEGDNIKPYIAAKDICPVNAIEITEIIKNK